MKYYIDYDQNTLVLTGNLEPKAALDIPRTIDDKLIENLKLLEIESLIIKEDFQIGLGDSLDILITFLKKFLFIISFHCQSNVGSKMLEGILTEFGNWFYYIHFPPFPVSDSTIQILAKVLSKSKVCMVLKLQQCSIGNHGIRVISEAISQSPTLQELDISNNKIGDKGAKFLEAMIQQNSSLTSLNIEGNLIGDEGIGNLCRAFVKTKRKQENIKTDNQRQRQKINFSYNFMVASLFSVISYTAITLPMVLTHTSKFEIILPIALTTVAILMIINNLYSFKMPNDEKLYDKWSIKYGQNILSRNILSIIAPITVSGATFGLGYLGYLKISALLSEGSSTEIVSLPITAIVFVLTIALDFVAQNAVKKICAPVKTIND